MLTHASCDVDIAGFGEIGEIGDLKPYVHRQERLNLLNLLFIEPMKCAFNRISVIGTGSALQTCFVSCDC